MAIDTIIAASPSTMLKMVIRVMGRANPGSPRATMRLAMKSSKFIVCKNKRIQLKKIKNQKAKIKDENTINKAESDFMPTTWSFRYSCLYRV